MARRTRETDRQLHAHPQRASSPVSMHNGERQSIGEAFAPSRMALHVMAGCRPRADVRHAGARQPADLSPPPDLGWQCNLGCMQSEPRTGQRSSRPSQPSRPEYQPSYRYCCPANAASAEMHLGAGGVLGSLGQTRTCAKSTGAVSHASWRAICGNVSSARGAPMSYASTTQDAEGDERRRATVKRPGPGTACRQHLQAR